MVRLSETGFAESREMQYVPFISYVTKHLLTETFCYIADLKKKVTPNNLPGYALLVIVFVIYFVPLHFI